MRFMVLVLPGNPKGYEVGQIPDQQLLADMGKFNSGGADGRHANMR